MKIKSQDGSLYEAYDLTQKKNQIYCECAPDRRNHNLLGTYSTNQRATEVFAEMFVANSNKQREFVMPAE